MGSITFNHLHYSLNQLHHLLYDYHISFMFLYYDNFDYDILLLLLIIIIIIMTIKIIIIFSSLEIYIVFTQTKVVYKTNTWEQLYFCIFTLFVDRSMFLNSATWKQLRIFIICSIAHSFQFVEIDYLFSLPISQFVPVYPGWHWHVYERNWSMQVPCTHGELKQSSGICKNDTIR